ncbi:uncharacterized protein [Asterias amurensis]|uniref:uncharacterized protein n=1 Tax=Asterias amurensis TaxID=7602 RepID=UPI003AB785FB
MDGSANKQRTTTPSSGLKRPAANAFIPLLLIKNGQALVKAVPYSILQRAMGTMQQSKRSRTESKKPETTSAIPESNGHQASSFPSCSNKTFSKPHDIGLSITDVKSISMNEYNKTAMKSQEKSHGVDTESMRLEQETNSTQNVGTLGSEADQFAKLKIKFSRQRNADPSTTWRVVPYNSTPAVSEKGHKDSRLRGPLTEQSSDNGSSGNMTKEHQIRQSDFNLARKWRVQEFEKSCARCKPFLNQPRATCAAPCESSSSSSAITTTEPSLTSSIHSFDNSTYQPELSMQYNVNRRKSKPRPHSPNTSLSTGSLPLVSPRGDHSCTDTSSSAGIPHKRRRLSAASSSGDFHSSIVEARPSQPDTSDTDSNTSSDLEDCPQWVYDKPVFSAKTTPVASKCRSREIPVVFESPRDEMIHNLKRLLEQQTQTLDELKAPGSRLVHAVWY